MHSAIERFSRGDRTDAFEILLHELADFSHDGLVELASDLTERSVARGTWSGCVISYRTGCPGSSRRDRQGLSRNAFTVLWDAGAITDEEVLALVRAELRRRTVSMRNSRLTHAS